MNGPAGRAGTGPDRGPDRAPRDRRAAAPAGRADRGDRRWRRGPASGSGRGPGRRPGLPRPMWREMAGFAAAGGAAYVADLGLFIWLRGPGGLGPLTAKALSFVAGCTVAYLGNALGTYRGRTPAVSRARQYGAFFAVNIVGALVQLVCLGFSHYVLGFTAPRDDVVSGLGIGMLLATALRFWGTRTLVFRPAEDTAPPGPPGGGPSAQGPPGGDASATGSTASVHGPGEGSRPTWTG